MSMQTECIYGIGFQIKIEPEELQKFLQDHRESLEQIRGAESILECLNLDKDAFKDAYFDFEYYPNNGFGYSPTATIADIMSVETGLPIAYYPSTEDDDHESILYERAYPWETLQKMKSLLYSKSMQTS